MLAIENLSKHYGSRIIFENISFRFPEGEKLALVGPNGAGKTTLLNILSGYEHADGGQVLKSQSIKIGYLPQEPEAQPEATVLAECMSGHLSIYQLKKSMDSALELLQTSNSDAHVHTYEIAEAQFGQAGGYGLEARASSILHGLGFQTQHIKKSPLALSGGWRMRLELAKVFINEPEIMILDEPTNHLDLPSLVWVERYLQTFRGTLIFVSHDRALLNRLATQTILLSHGQMRCYKGNFDRLLEQRELEQTQNESRRVNLGKQREQLEDFVERFGAKASKAKQAQSKAKQIEKLRELEEQIETPLQQSSMHLKLPEAPQSGRDVLDVKKFSIGYTTPLASGIDLLIERGLRIAIIGCNGIGKSTFLKTIAGQIPPLEGQAKFGHNTKIAYCAQNHEDILDYEKTILDNLLQARAELGEKEARQILGSFLFSGEDVFKQVKVLSGGEKARVALCRSMIEPSNLLLLDEPTNHLDMSSVEVLIEGLATYSGSLLFVSHDRSFIEALATHIFVMLPDGRSALFHGNLDDYQRLAATQGFPNVINPQIEKETSVSNLSTQDNKNIPRDFAQSQELAKQLKKDRNKLQKLIEKLESEQNKSRNEISQIEMKLTTLDPQNYTLAQTTHQKMQELETHLSNLEEQWIEAAEALEAIESQLSVMGRLGGS